ncbi:MAG: hypothetical protein QOE51_434 [Actinoplanes sp.]|jgi:hypothetical protein|nr:hypothetical protein [Actinoplanes sp.]
MVTCEPAADRSGTSSHGTSRSDPESAYDFMSSPGSANLVILVMTTRSPSRRTVHWKVLRAGLRQPVDARH